MVRPVPVCFIIIKYRAGILAGEIPSFRKALNPFRAAVRSIPVIQKYCQLNKKEPQGKIELHLGGCKQNNHKPEVQNEFNTE